MRNSKFVSLFVLFPCILLTVLYGGGLWFVYRKVDAITKDPAVPALIENGPEAKEPIGTLIEEAEVAKKQLWSALQAKSRDAVVQVFSQITEFNWIEPYKTPNQNEATGSAFFINAEGDLITNAHVVNQAILVTIQVPTVGKRRFKVTVIGVSPERDLAVLRLDKSELESLKKELKTATIPFLKLGDSDAVQRGDKIMALGYPLGQHGLKSTTGVVSGRENLMGHYFIQISAPINPGNSGGPSLDNRGRVVGVNTAMIKEAQNVGYIIPINDVILFLDQLSTLPETEGPKLVRKPFLGIFFNSNSNEYLTSFLKNPPPGGLYVVDVYKGGPFDKAGIKAGDMIYKIDDYPVDTFGEMSVPWSKEDRISIVDYVARLKLGHLIRLEYYRAGALKKASFKLTYTEPPIRTMYPGYEKIDYEVLSGFVFMPITMNHIVLLAKYAPELILYADVKKQIEPGLLITHVLLNSPASRARTVGAGGIISEINGQRVRTLQEFRKAIPLSCDTGYLTIKTTDNQFAVLPLREIMQDEPRLSMTYFYPYSPSYKELRDKLGIVDNALPFNKRNNI